jgi:hypothetical protein
MKKLTQKFQTVKQTSSINRIAQIVSSSAFNQATGQSSFAVDFNQIKKNYTQIGQLFVKVCGRGLIFIIISVKLSFSCLFLAKQMQIFFGIDGDAFCAR